MMAMRQTETATTVKRSIADTNVVGIRDQNADTRPSSPTTWRKADKERFMKAGLLLLTLFCTVRPQFLVNRT
jgi:hypothetical protein